jgi:uncharacterized repeat protein (TIGR01451 family)
MRKRILGALLAGLVGVGGQALDARAGGTIDLLFVGIDGAPIAATNTVTVSPGAVLTMAAVMTTDSFLTVSLFSLNYDTDGDNELELVSVFQWRGVAINQGGTDFYAPVGAMNDATETFVGSFQGATTNFGLPRLLPPSGGAFAGGYQMGTVTWAASGNVNDDGADITSGILNFNVDFFAGCPGGFACDGSDAFTDIGNLVLFRSATVNFTPGSPTASVSATKSDALVTDADGDGDVDAGDTLRYTVVIENDGAADAQGVVFSDSPDANAPLVDGTVTTTQGTVTLGNGAGETSVGVDIGTISAGGSVTVTFDVAVVDPLAEGVASVANQGVVTASGLADVPSDDPDTGAAGDPTVTQLETGLEACQEEVASCESDLGACESDLGTCQEDLGDAQEALAACQNDPPFEDADGDGEHDDTDACPGTPAGAPVDQAGCSLAEFCAGYDISGTNRNSPCNQADWRNDEPLDAEDCKGQGGVCQPR